MDLVLQIVVAGRACRNTANIKNRQPIGQMYVKADFELPEFYQEIVEDELNLSLIHIFIRNENIVFTVVLPDIGFWNIQLGIGAVSIGSNINADRLVIFKSAGFT